MREKPGAINEDTDTDSVMLHSKDEDEPPPLLKVCGVIDWQKQRSGNELIIIESNGRKIIQWFVGNRKCKEIEAELKSG